MKINIKYLNVQKLYIKLKYLKKLFYNLILTQQLNEI